MKKFSIYCKQYMLYNQPHAVLTFTTLYSKIISIWTRDLINTQVHIYSNMHISTSAHSSFYMFILNTFVTSKIVESALTDKFTDRQLLK